MAKRERSEFPDWAERERARDLAWLRENLHILWPAAQAGYTALGRGALVIDTTSRPTGEGNPFVYLDQTAIEQEEDEDTLRMVQEYDPAEEMVTTLLKTQDRISSYRMRVIPREPGKNLGNSVEPDTEKSSEEPTAPEDNTAPLEPPDIKTLMIWEEEGGCEAACPHKCWVEADGVCEHGHPSWLVKLGLI